jgi:hypothetical protein
VTEHLQSAPTHNQPYFQAIVARGVEALKRVENSRQPALVDANTACYDWMP